MFPQLGAPIGFLCSSAIYLVLSKTLTNAQFMEFGWRLPFIASSLLVAVGLYVRLNVTETPVFQKALDKHQQVQVPLLTVFREHLKPLILGTLTAIATFLLFYLLVAFCLSWGTAKLGFNRERFLLIQMLGVLFFAAAIPISALLADKYGRRLTLLVVSVGILAYGLVFGPLFAAGLGGAIATMVVGFALMGLTYGPLGTLLSELFPTTVRYTGSSLTFNLAGILGGSFAPAIASSLATAHGLSYVGYYLSTAALLTLVGLWFSRETRDATIG